MTFLSSVILSVLVSLVVYVILKVWTLEKNLAALARRSRSNTSEPAFDYHALQREAAILANMSDQACGNGGDGLCVFAQSTTPDACPVVDVPEEIVDGASECEELPALEDVATSDTIDECKLAPDAADAAAEAPQPSTEPRKRRLKPKKSTDDFA